MTFEDYLRSEIKLGKIDFILRAQTTPTGVEFYIHPANVDGKTADFSVQSNELTTKYVCGEDKMAPWLRKSEGLPPDADTEEWLRTMQEK